MRTFAVVLLILNVASALLNLWIGGKNIPVAIFNLLVATLLFWGLTLRT
jgi:hypothetical protein